MVHLDHSSSLENLLQESTNFCSEFEVIIIIVDSLLYITLFIYNNKLLFFDFAKLSLV